MALVSESAVVFLDKSGNMIKKVNFADGISKFHFDSDQLCIMSSDKNKRIVSYDSCGTEKYNTVALNTDYIYTFGGNIYSLIRNRIVSTKDNSIDITLDYVPQEIHFDKDYMFVFYYDNVTSIKVD